MFKPSHIRGLKKLAPFIVLVAAIPVFVLFVTSPAKFTLLSQASLPKELRVWLEPDILHLAPGQSSEVWVMARFSPDETYMQNLVVLVQTEDEKVRLSPAEVRLPNPFYGQVRVGTVTVTAPQARGNYAITPLISLPAESTQETQLITETGTILVN